MQFNQQDEDGEALEFRVAAWIPLTLCIPASRLFDCYVWAMQNRTSDFPLSAPDLVKAWRGIQDRNETQAVAESGKHKMLPKYAEDACQRCYGTGKEEMPDGSVRPDCQHLPFTDEEKRDRVQAKADAIQFLRDAVKKIGSPKPPPPDALPPKPKGVRLYCTNPECGRSKRPVSSLFFAEGGTCKDLLNRGDYDDLAEMKLCDGVFINRGNHA